MRLALSCGAYNVGNLPRSGPAFQEDVEVADKSAATVALTSATAAPVQEVAITLEDGSVVSSSDRGQITFMACIALIVAVEKYKDSHINPVAFAEADAKDFASALQMHNFDVQNCTAEPARHENYSGVSHQTGSRAPD
jgi:hypothetical protein